MSAFGFAPLPPAPAPDPRAVGQALAAQRIAAPAAPAMPGPGRGAVAPEPSVGDPLEHSLRLLGAMRSGGTGQTGTGSAPPGMPDAPADDWLHHSMRSAAEGEALTRLGGGIMPNPTRTPASATARRQQLLRLGLSPFEVSLLEKSGGA